METCFKYNSTKVSRRRQLQAGAGGRAHQALSHHGDPMRPWVARKWTTEWNPGFKLPPMIAMNERPRPTQLPQPRNSGSRSHGGSLSGSFTFITRAGKPQEEEKGKSSRGRVCLNLTAAAAGRRSTEGSHGRRCSALDEVVIVIM